VKVPVAPVMVETSTIEMMLGSSGVGSPCPGRENTVSVGREEGNRANAAPKINSDIDLFLISRGISAELGGIPRCGPRYEQDRELNLVGFD